MRCLGRISVAPCLIISSAIAMLAEMAILPFTRRDKFPASGMHQPTAFMVNSINHDKSAEITPSRRMGRFSGALLHVQRSHCFRRFPGRRKGGSRRLRVSNPAGCRPALGGASAACRADGHGLPMRQTCPMLAAAAAAHAQCAQVPQRQGGRMRPRIPA